MLRNAPNILYPVLWSFKIYQSVCSSEDKYPSFIKKIYFSFSGFYTRKWIRLLRYDFSLSCKITCSKGIVRDRHYTSCTTKIALNASHKGSNIPFSIRECLNNIASQIEDETMFSQEQIRSGAPSFHRSNAIDDRNEARHVSKVNTDNSTHVYVFLRIFMEENALGNDGEVCSSVAKNIFGEPVMFPSVFREREAFSLFRRGQRQSTPSFTAKSYFRWKFIALARIEASFPAERNKESVWTATRAKDNWHAILSCPFSPAGRSLLAMANPVDFFPEELYGCAS